MLKHCTAFLQHYSIIILFLIAPAHGIGQFSYKVYGNVANYFSDTTDMLAFFEFSKGQCIAEVGAFDGKNVVGFSMLTDSVVFYAQDIDSSQLTVKKLNKRVDKAKKRTKKGNTFKVTIGQETATNLPDSLFDKIILISTFHEFSKMHDMISDIRTKLKPDGKLYILEARCYTPGHVNYTAAQTKNIVESHGFKLILQDGKDINNSTGLYRMIFIRG